MRALFGMGREKFDQLAEGMGRLYLEQLASKKERKRGVGGGRRGQIPTGQHKLAFILFYLKVYPTSDVMGVFSGINGPECSRWVHKLMPLLEKLLGQKQHLPKRKINSMEGFAAAFPQTLEVMLDGMDRPVRRSKKKRRSASTTQGKRRATHARRLSLWMGSAA